MCGIAGLVALPGSGPLEIEGAVASMIGCLAHRGPDDSGTWTDSDSRVALGHRRLSIVDLSVAGHQPMISRSGRFVIVYNGEIYNCEALRSKLEAVSGTVIPWRGHSDTEVLLQLIESYGFVKAMTMCNGMFALALWDRQQRSLLLARDRLGEKPLYYGIVNGHLAFASELKALRRVPGFGARIDPAALSRFLHTGYVAGAATLYDGIAKLPPASYLRFEPGDRGALGVPLKYWSLDEAVASGGATPFDGSGAEAIEALDQLMSDAVGIRMHADVPLGAFLSGGIDSSYVVALMQKQSARPVRTFSIGFREAAFDEAPAARAVAAHLGTDHTELTVTAEEALRVIPHLGHIYDEPLGDPSQVPTCLLAALTREHVTVSLSGDGGDELFAGYQRYQTATRLWAAMRRIPRPVRAGAAVATRVMPTQALALLFRPFAGLIAEHGRPGNAGDKIKKLGMRLSASDADDLYYRLIRVWDEEIVVGADGASLGSVGPAGGSPAGGFVERMRYHDLRYYLPDDILFKLDRATMAVSLEGRVPFLDHRVVEFAWTLPPSLLINAREGKWVLRRALERYLPTALVNQPKRGFGIPLQEWLRGPLREWAESLLTEECLRADGLLKAGPIRAKWMEHVRGERNWQHEIWNVLMFQAWRAAQHG